MSDTPETPNKIPYKEKLSFPQTDALVELCGYGNSRLKLLEQTAEVAVHLRGTDLTIEGEKAKVGVAVNALQQLYVFAQQGAGLASDDVVRAVNALRSDSNLQLKNIFSDTILKPKRGRPITPKSLRQKQYVDAVRQADVVFGIGPAGTGKTYLAVALAVRMLQDKVVKRIILTRPAVEAGERLGFLPGTLEEKVDPYLRPLFDALNEMLDHERARKLLDKGVIEVAPLAFMRGRTLNDSFVIFDEAQNSTPEQMKMLLTRLGFGSKAVITGDVTQSDLPLGNRSGLVDARRVLRRVPGIRFCEFSDGDVVRHPLVMEVIRAYDARDRAREARSASKAD
ncbi:MAG: PhoH family protein [Myxococcales bacterium]|nr:PhoH family protein [Myxococcales bacterium]